MELSLPAAIVFAVLAVLLLAVSGAGGGRS